LCVQGLQVGDEIIQFGSVSAANFVNMQSIAGVVEHSQGVSYLILHWQIIDAVDRELYRHRQTVIGESSWSCIG